jgi:hypothetical protein
VIGLVIGSAGAAVEVNMVESVTGAQAAEELTKKTIKMSRLLEAQITFGIIDIPTNEIIAGTIDSSDSAALYRAIVYYFL